MVCGFLMLFCAVFIRTSVQCLYVLLYSFAVFVLPLCPPPVCFSMFVSLLRWLNTVLAVCEYTSFAKSWQENGCR